MTRLHNRGDSTPLCGHALAAVAPRVSSDNVKFPNWGHKISHKKEKIFINIITQYTLCPLLHNIYVTRTMNLMPKRMLPVLPTVLIVCWINETALNLVPFFAVSNLGNNKSLLALNEGSRVDGITWGSLVSTETQEQRPKNALVHCHAEDTRTHFPETRA
jgi:hypothetical protein